MTDLVDLLTPTRGAIYRGLEAAGVPDLAPIYNDIPVGAKVPFVAIGEITSTDEGEKGAQLEEITVTLLVVDQGKSRARLLTIAQAARAALHKKPLDAPGVALRPPRWDETQVSSAAADGVTYAAKLTFILTGQPA